MLDLIVPFQNKVIAWYDKFEVILRTLTPLLLLNQKDYLKFDFFLLIK